MNKIYKNRQNLLLISSFFFVAADVDVNVSIDEFRRNGVGSLLFLADLKFISVHFSRIDSMIYLKSAADS